MFNNTKDSNKESNSTNDSYLTNKSKDSKNTNSFTSKNASNKNADNKSFSHEKNSTFKKQKKKSTSSFKHVNYDRERPQLTRNSNPKNGDSNRSNRRHNQNFRGSFDSSKKDPNAKLDIIPLGGLDAIGKNMTAFKCGNDLILDDAGLMFPDDDHPGIDLILPDYTYVLENAQILKGIIITHGHEDHTGALPYLMKDLDVQIPIYASKLTLGLIEGKFKEHKVKNAKLIEVKSGDTIKLGCFKVTFFSVNHSIPGALGIFIESPAGNVLHMGDFKLDQTPIDGVTTDFAALAKFGQIGVDLMLSDSTNATSPNFTPSEAEVGKELRKIISSAKGRVIIASFASHIHRMQQICDAAVEAGRKVVVTGRSMIQNTDIARKLGYLDISDKDLIDAYDLSNTPPEDVVIMCTGSQGEPLSALARIANGEHKTIDIEEGDTVIISATPVPGNEKAVTRVINSLIKLGVDIYDKKRAMVHVSGHAGAEELKIVLSIVKPKAFLPVHGEIAHLQAHAKLAEATGVQKNNIFILENGDSLRLTSKGVERGESFQSGIIYVDGLSVGDTSQDVLDERSNLGSQGFASVACAISLKKKQLVGSPAIEMRGITGGDDKNLIADISSSIASTAAQTLRCSNPTIREVRRDIRNTVSQILWDKTKQRPMIIVNLLEV